MKRVRLHLIIAALGVTALTVSPIAQTVREDVPELQSIDVEQNLGDTIPLDLSFVDDRGRPVTLNDYFHDGIPVVLILGYYRCPMLCNLVFNGMTTALSDVSLRMGRDYRVVTVSIDPTETHELAAAKKENYLEQLGERGDAGNWSFLTGDSARVAQLAESLGFKYYYVEERDEYAHPAVIHLLTEDGVISRYLFGIQYSPLDLRLGLLEAGDGQIGSTADKLLLYCYHYDPEAGSYAIFARNVMTLGGVATVALLGLFLGGLWLRERYRKGQHDTENSEKISVGT